MGSMATFSVRYSKSKIRGQKHPREVVKNRNSIQNIKVNTLYMLYNKQRLSTSGIGQPVPHDRSCSCWENLPNPQALVARALSCRNVLSLWCNLIFNIFIFVYLYTISIFQLKLSNLCASNFSPITSLHKLNQQFFLDLLSSHLQPLSKTNMGINFPSIVPLCTQTSPGKIA